MAETVLGVVVIVFVGAVLFGTCAQGVNNGRELGRCEERWKYQHSVVDTLATVRSGCKLPITKTSNEK